METLEFEPSDNEELDPSEELVVPEELKVEDSASKDFLAIFKRYFHKGDGSTETPFEVRPAEHVDGGVYCATRVSRQLDKDVSLTFNEHSFTINGQELSIKPFESNDTTYGHSGPVLESFEKLKRNTEKNLR